MKPYKNNSEFCIKSNKLYLVCNGWSSTSPNMFGAWRVADILFPQSSPDACFIVLSADMNI